MSVLAANSAFVPTGRDFVAIESEIVLSLSIVGLLLARFFTGRQSNAISGAIAMTGVVIAFMLTLVRTIETGHAFGGMLVLDPAAVFWEQILLLFTGGVIAMWFLITRKHVRDGEAPEFFTLILASTLGMMAMGQTTNLLMAVMVTEIASMPCYILAGFRKHHRNSAEGALKFVLFGAVCTAIMIYGASLLYGTHGSLDIATIAESIQQSGALSLATIFGLLAVFVGLLFKISGFPFHFWAPDVLEGSTADVAVFLSVASKSAGIVLLARFATILAPASQALTDGIAITLGAAAVASMIVGNLGAMQQTSVKRLLAFSSIAHAGYMMGAVALVLPGHIDSAMTVLGIYLAIYLFMQLGAFAAVGEVEAARGDDHLISFRGLSTLAPLSAAGLAIAMISMIGLPPFGGFWAKLKVMILCAQQGQWWWVIVASIAINSIISVGFYGRVLRAMYLDKTEPNAPRYGPLTGLIPILCAAALVATFIFLSPLEQTSNRMSEQEREIPLR